MGKPDPFPKKHKSAKTKEKFLTDFREKKPRENFYNTSPNEKHKDAQNDYLRNNLQIKTCVCGNLEILKFQTKKVSFRNYTPKILNQEVNMGMWMWVLEMSMLATIGQVAHFAGSLTGNPLAIIGLVPIFAAGLAFMRYVSIDPESHPVNVRHVRHLLSHKYGKQSKKTEKWLRNFSKSKF